MRNSNFGISVLMVLALGFTSAVTPAISIAGPIPSSLGVQHSQRQADIDRINAALGNPKVLQALARAGTNAEEMRGRLAEMNDHDVHQLATRMHDVKSGGLITEVLVIVLLVLLILYLWPRV